MRISFAGMVGAALIGFAAMAPSTASAVASWDVQAKIALYLGAKSNGSGGLMTGGRTTGNGTLQMAAQPLGTSPVGGTFTAGSQDILDLDGPASSTYATSSFRTTGSGTAVKTNAVNLNTAGFTQLSGLQVDYEGVANDGGRISSEIDNSPLIMRMRLTNNSASNLILDFGIYTNLISVISTTTSKDLASVNTFLELISSPNITLFGSTHDATSSPATVSQAGTPGGATAPRPAMAFSTHIAPNSTGTVDLVMRSYAEASSVPVPAALPLLASAIGVVGLVARRRRKTAA